MDWVADAARSLEPDPFVVVTAPAFAESFDGYDVAIQQEPLGTGHAVIAGPFLARRPRGRRARPGRRRAPSPPRDPRELLETHRSSDAAATVLTFTREDPGSYGRIVRGEDGTIRAIVEATDLSPEEQAITEVNSSIYVFDAASLWPTLERLDPANAQGELYLTDAVRLLVEDGARVAAHGAEPGEAEGVNTRVELAAAAAALRDRINEEHMLAGVTIVDPATTWIEPSVELEPDATIHPFTVLRGQTRVAGGAEVGPTSSPSTPRSAPVCSSGPSVTFAPARSSRRTRRRARSWRSRTRAWARGPRFPTSPIIGDAEIGEGTNIAAGNITVNYPHEPGQAQEPDDDRGQRQDRRPECLRCSGRDWRGRLDCGGVRHHEGRPARRARRRPSATGEQGGLRLVETVEPRRR